MDALRWVSKLKPETPMRLLMPLLAATTLTADARHRLAIEGMVWDQSATTIAARHALSRLNVTWEDTGRSTGPAGVPTSAT